MIAARRYLLGNPEPELVGLLDIQEGDVIDAATRIEMLLMEDVLGRRVCMSADFEPQPFEEREWEATKPHGIRVPIERWIYRPLARVYVVFDAVEGESVPELRVYRNRPDVAGVVECMLESLP